MKQFTQHVKKGTMQVEEIPPPSVNRGGVVVQNHYSLISAGTERSSIRGRQSGLVSRARANPDLIKLVFGQIKQQGLRATYQRVTHKLDEHAALGYSSAGVVVAVANDVNEFSVGDRVACAGATANHAEIIAVPKNLCAKVPPAVSLKDAAYTTVGAIALQGVRQTAPTLGETVVVIGLGLLGQITVQILKAAGCSVIGIDMDPHLLKVAKASGADIVYHRLTDGLQSDVQSFTRGFGADAVIITAATKTNDPIQLAGEISRDKGRVIVVGDVGLSVPRTPYYLKELDLHLSRSYGPGRYDRSYEEQGIDYPIGYVRWTEKRNMEEFLHLVQDKKISLEMLTTHVFPIEKAVPAFQMISGKGTKNYIGVLLEYTPEKKQSASVMMPIKNGSRGPVSVGFIGAGSFAQSSLLPNLNPKMVTLKGVCNADGLSSKNVARQYGFEMATAHAHELIASPEIETIFIATRHDSHASYCLDAIKNRKHVFVEKPLALNEEDLTKIAEARAASLKKSHLRFLVGYNRRFTPTVRTMKRFFDQMTEPMMITYRINAGFLPRDHWTQDPITGGGRIIGEVCHFIDTIQFLSNGKPTQVYAQSLSVTGNRTQSDNSAITIRLDNGSVGVITYLANGDSAVPKERIEVACGGKTAILDNFKRLELFAGGSCKITESSIVEKGHRIEVEEFIASIHSGQDLIPFESLIATTRATFKILESLESGLPVLV